MRKILIGLFLLLFTVSTSYSQDLHKYSTQEVVNIVLNDPLSAINFHHYSTQEVFNLALDETNSALKADVEGISIDVDGRIVVDGLVVIDPTSLAGESLDEVDFTTHAEWDDTNDMDSESGNAAYTWSAQQTSTLTQLQASLVIAGVADVYYKFTYTVAVTTAFDGDGAATITTAFALAAVSLDLTTGTNTVYFRSAAVPTDFIISIVSGTDTEGTFTIDDVTLKQITGGRIDIAGDLWVNGVDIGAGLGAIHAAVTLHASATTGGMSLAAQEISNRAATNAQTGYMTAALVGNIENNNAKVTNATHTGHVTGSGALTLEVIPAATMTLGSDADGDIYYRMSNVLTRLPKGSAAEVLTMNGGATAPEWAAAAGGGDFADGGEAGGGDRTLGNTDEFAMGFETNNVERAQFTSAGHFVPIGTHAYDLGSAAADWNNAYFAIGYIGTLYSDGGIWHTGDADTKITFADDKAEYHAGGVKFIEFVEDAVDYISLGESADINVLANAFQYDYGEALWNWQASKTVLYGANAHVQHSLKTVTYNSTETELYSDRGNIQTLTFGAGNIATLDFNVPEENNSMDIVLIIKQDGTGSRTITTWDASVFWAGGTAPTLSAGADAVDMFRFIYDGTNWLGYTLALDLQ